MAINMTKSAIQSQKQTKSAPDWSGWLLKVLGEDLAALAVEGAERLGEKAALDWLSNNEGSSQERELGLLLRRKASLASVVAAFLGCGANPRAADAHGGTALMYAAWEGDAECVKLLMPLSDLKASSKIGRTPLMFATVRCNAACMELLLPESDANEPDGDGLTPLMVAVMGNNISGVDLLLPSSSPGAVDQRGKTALILAAESSYRMLYENNDEDLRIIDLLLTKSDAQAVDNTGLSAFGAAMKSEHWGCAERLAHTVDLDTLKKAVAVAGPGKMPAAQARLEHQELVSAIAPAVVEEKERKKQKSDGIDLPEARASLRRL